MIVVLVYSVFIKAEQFVEFTVEMSSQISLYLLISLHLVFTL